MIVSRSHKGPVVDKTRDAFGNSVEITPAGGAGELIYLFIFLLNFNLFPPPRGRHASCQEMSYRELREAKLKKVKKNRKFPLYAL